MDFGFRPLEEADYGRLHRWLNEPHVVDSYGLGHRPTSPEVAAKYGRLVRGEDPTRAYVIEVDSRPVGYVQTYRILDHPDYAAEIGVADETHGMDLFLGEPSLVGHGIGPAVIDAFVRTEIFARTPAVAVLSDPPSSNPRSVRAFEKAGFVLWRRHEPRSPGQGDLLLRRAR
jgi:aminoglycoside 6'-N-acetyltransferase